MPKVIAYTTDLEQVLYSLMTELVVYISYKVHYISQLGQVKKMNLLSLVGEIKR